MTEFTEASAIYLNDRIFRILVQNSKFGAFRTFTVYVLRWDQPQWHHLLRSFQAQKWSKMIKNGKMTKNDQKHKAQRLRFFWDGFRGLSLMKIRKTDSRLKMTLFFILVFDYP